MKTLKSLVFAIFVMAFTINTATAQNYKAPKIDASGQITDKNGKYIGKINLQGEIMDTTGTKIAYIDANGMLINAKTGKPMGKAEKNGNYLPHFPKALGKWTTSTPMQGKCLVKNEKGEVVAEVHENYKQQGACAIYCLQNHMNHHEVLDKSKSAATYTCPMHPDVVSDKPGKCPKCGMDLVKKTK